MISFLGKRYLVTQRMVPSESMIACNKLMLVGGVTLLTIGALFIMHPMAQDPTYHDFADKRKWLGIANFANFISNLPFIFFSAWSVCGV